MEGWLEGGKNERERSTNRRARGREILTHPKWRRGTDQAGLKPGAKNSLRSPMLVVGPKLANLLEGLHWQGAGVRRTASEPRRSELGRGVHHEP